MTLSLTFQDYAMSEFRKLKEIEFNKKIQNLYSERKNSRRKYGL